MTQPTPQPSPAGSTGAAGAAGAADMARAGSAAGPATGSTAGARLSMRSLGRIIRELADELVFVFVLVMFIKLFLVEHYKIPTGSMTPTLIGTDHGGVAYADIDGDGRKDLIYWDDWLETPRVFLWRDGRYQAAPDLEPNAADVERWRREGLIHEQFDHILVNKLAYWFRQPKRGEIVVFKVPPAIWKPEAPIYIKRLAGQPGEDLTFTPEGRLVVDGQVVEQPPFYQQQDYRATVDLMDPNFTRQPEIAYHPLSSGALRLDVIHVPPDKAYVFGDNTLSSLDSRYWGGVPLNNFKGKAFLRIFPFGQFKFLK